MACATEASIVKSGTKVVVVSISRFFRLIDSSGINQSAKRYRRCVHFAILTVRVFCALNDRSGFSLVRRIAFVSHLLCQLPVIGGERGSASF